MSEEKISAAIMAYNEEPNIPDLMKSLEGVDEVVIVDNGSTDDTVKLARELGATVYEAGRSLMEKYIPTKDDIEKFKTMFGWEPTFTEDMKFPDYSEIRNFAASLASNDWIFAIDCDERVEWLLPQLKKIMEQFDIITYQCFNSPNEILFHQKLYRKSISHWMGWYHEFMTQFDLEKPVRSARIQDGMKVHHYPRPRTYRKKALSILEFSSIVAPNFRSLYYLGREYGSCDMHEKSIKTLDMFMDSDNIDYGSLNEALLLQGISYNHIGEIQKARQIWLTAVERNPDFQDPLRLLAITSRFKEHQDRWNSFADLATGDGSLFLREKDFWEVEETGDADGD